MPLITILLTGLWTMHDFNHSSDSFTMVFTTTCQFQSSTWNRCIGYQLKMSIISLLFGIKWLISEIDPNNSAGLSAAQLGHLIYQIWAKIIILWCVHIIILLSLLIFKTIFKTKQYNYVKMPSHFDARFSVK